MRNKIVVFIVSFIVWIFLNCSMDYQYLITGFIVSGIVTFLTADLFNGCDKYYFGRIKRYYWFLYYAPLFIYEMLKANIYIVFKIMEPRLKIKPGIIKVKTNLRSDVGLTLLANSVSLATGSLCVDIDPQDRSLYVHCVNINTEDMNILAKKITFKFEDILNKIFI